VDECALHERSAPGERVPVAGEGVHGPVEHGERFPGVARHAQNRCGGEHRPVCQRLRVGEGGPRVPDGGLHRSAAAHDGFRDDAEQTALCGRVSGRWRCGLGRGHRGDAGVVEVDRQLHGVEQRHQVRGQRGIPGEPQERAGAAGQRVLHGERGPQIRVGGAVERGREVFARLRGVVPGQLGRQGDPQLDVVRAELDETAQVAGRVPGASARGRLVQHLRHPGRVDGGQVDELVGHGARVVPELVQDDGRAVPQPRGLGGAEHVEHSRPVPRADVVGQAVTEQVVPAQGGDPVLGDPCGHPGERPDEFLLVDDHERGGDGAQVFRLVAQPPGGDELDGLLPQRPRGADVGEHGREVARDAAGQAQAQVREHRVRREVQGRGDHVGDLRRGERVQIDDVRAGQVHVQRRVLRQHQADRFSAEPAQHEVHPADGRVVARVEVVEDQADRRPLRQRQDSTPHAPVHAVEGGRGLVRQFRDSRAGLGEQPAGDGERQAFAAAARAQHRCPGTGLGRDGEAQDGGLAGAPATAHEHGLSASATTSRGRVVRYRGEHALTTEELRLVVHRLPPQARSDPALRINAPGDRTANSARQVSKSGTVIPHCAGGESTAGSSQ
jgi:hypothetical protein